MVNNVTEYKETEKVRKEGKPPRYVTSKGIILVEKARRLRDDYLVIKMMNQV